MSGKRQLNVTDGLVQDTATDNITREDRKGRSKRDRIFHLRTA